MNASNEPWYRAGLPFECTRCGHCCTGAPGVVWVSMAEAEELARQLELNLEEFAAQFLRRIEHRLALVERRNGDCTFWDREAGCTVYAVRPTQCRTWPFWPKHLESPEAWQATQRFCPGSRAGRLHALEEVEESARQAAEALR